MRRIPVLWWLLGLLLSLAVVNYDLDLACRFGSECSCSDNCPVCHAAGDVHSVRVPAVVPCLLAVLTESVPPLSLNSSPIRLEASDRLFYRHTVWKTPSGLRGPPPA